MQSELRSVILLLICMMALAIDDWLIKKVKIPVTLKQEGSTMLTLSNGLIARTFLIVPGFATVDYRSLMSDASILRAIKPEAILTLDDTTYNIGGMMQNNHFGYLNRSGLNISVDVNAWQYVDHCTSKPEAPYPWTPGSRGAPKDVSWPPKGLHMAVKFRAPDSAPSSHKDVNVWIHYEMYVGIPLMSKWLTATMSNSSGCNPVKRGLHHHLHHDYHHHHHDHDHVPVNVVKGAQVEYLAVNRPYSPMVFDAQIGLSWFKGPKFGGDESSMLWVQSDQAHATVVQWQVDKMAGKHDMPGASEPVLNASYSAGFGIGLNDTEQFISFRVLELVTDTTDPERHGLCRRKMARTLAPATMENPIFFHLTRKDAPVFDVRNVIDQMAEVGFEMMIWSFGSDFNAESKNVTYIKEMAADIAYANSKGIEVGGYDHICWGRNAGKIWDRIDPDTGKTTKDACFASGFVDQLTSRLINFINQTGLSMLETDGPYSGLTCASTVHAHHKGLSDSVYQQTQLQNGFYHTMREMGLYTNQPDSYFYQGANKAAMGYAEVQFNLPRFEDLSVSRAGMYDDTYLMLPSQGWMFVPLVDYHGGGTAAAFEPLDENLADYEWALAQYLGNGIAACYRGYRLYDTNRTKAVVAKWVTFYKKYRDIVTSDIIHVKRPDMQNIDCMLHVNPFITNRGMAMVYNPTDQPIKKQLVLPLYYTGIVTTALVQNEETGKQKKYTLNREYSITLDINLAARSLTWFLIQSAD